MNQDKNLSLSLEELGQFIAGYHCARHPIPASQLPASHQPDSQIKPVDQAAEDFARYLRAERNKAWLTQQELANKADLSETTIFALEKGLILSTMIRTQTLQKLADALELDVAHLALMLDRPIPARGVMKIFSEVQLTWVAVVAYFGSPIKAIAVLALMICTLLSTLFYLDGSSQSMFHIMPSHVGGNDNNSGQSPVTPIISYVEKVELAPCIPLFGMDCSWNMPFSSAFNTVLVFSDVMSVILLLLGMWFAIWRGDVFLRVNSVAYDLMQGLTLRGLIYGTPTILIVLVTVYSFLNSEAIFPIVRASVSSIGTIPYQGYLTDENDTPLTGNYSIQFSLYNQAAGGSPLWAENRSGTNQVQSTDGLFNVMLGSITSIGQNVITTDNRLYLGITIGTDDELQPRVELGRVPFALAARQTTEAPGSGSRAAIKQVDSGEPSTYTISATRYHIESTKAQIDIEKGNTILKVAATDSINTSISDASTTALYFSSSTGGKVGGVRFTDEDILNFDAGSGRWFLYFDGSDVGLRKKDVNAFHILGDGNILLSLEQPQTIEDVKYDDSDIIKFTATSLGNRTRGSFSMYFDGSDVQLTTNGEDIDALSLLTNDDLVVSTLGTARVTNKIARDEDMLRVHPKQLGNNTQGIWSLYLDNPDVKLFYKNEDIWAVWVDDSIPQVHLNTFKNYNAGGLKGDSDDILVCGGPVGKYTSCKLSLEWDGDDYGFGSGLIDGYSAVHWSSSSRQWRSKFADAIISLRSKRITSGYMNNRYSIRYMPTKYITRAQMARMLIRELAYPQASIISRLSNWPVHDIEKTGWRPLLQFISLDASILFIFTIICLIVTREGQIIRAFRSG